MTTARPRLEIEAVPETAWGQNARTLLRAKDWDRLRNHVFNLAGHKCQICGGIGPRHPVEGHEIWSWDDEKGIQALKGVISLCPACHRVKHWGNTCRLGLEKQAMRHIATVNGWGPIEVLDHRAAAELLWEQRSSRAWVLDSSGILAQLASVPA